MNTEEMNLALAKWMGLPTENRLFWYCPRCDREVDANHSFTHHTYQVRQNAPHFSKSLDLIRTVEEKLTEEQFGPYVFELMLIVGVNYSSAYERRMTSATAAQKAEALVRALGLAKEGL